VVTIKPRAHTGLRKEGRDPTLRRTNPEPVSPMSKKELISTPRAYGAQAAAPAEARFAWRATPVENASSSSAARGSTSQGERDPVPLPSASAPQR